MPEHLVSREHGPIALGYPVTKRALDCFPDLQALLQGTRKFVAPLHRVVDPLDRLDFDEARARLPDVTDALERIHRL